MGFDSTSPLDAIPRPVQLVLAAVGGVFILSKALVFLRFVLSVFVLGGTKLRKYGGPGTWVVITGASDGLGKEFALQLAAKGYHLVLVSRTQSKLDALAAAITAQFSAENVRVQTLAMDFARDDPSDHARLAELVAVLDVGILVNNVGRSHGIPVPFMQTAAEELQSIVTINCLGTLKATRAVLPAMVARKRPGLVLTMGSFAGWAPIPYLATYSASKAFLQFWSSALAEELRPQGIDVQICLGYLITTAMSKVRRASAVIPAPAPFVRSALSKIGTGGWQAAPSTYTPWWAHAVMAYAAESTVGTFSRLLIRFNLRSHVDIRNRALRKATREAKAR